jgi:hypothetical protein
VKSEKQVGTGVKEGQKEGRRNLLRGVWREIFCGKGSKDSQALFFFTEIIAKFFIVKKMGAI